MRFKAYRNNDIVFKVVITDNFSKADFSMTADDGSPVSGGNIGESTAVFTAKTAELADAAKWPQLCDANIDTTVTAVMGGTATVHLTVVQNGNNLSNLDDPTSDVLVSGLGVGVAIPTPTIRIEFP